MNHMVGGSCRACHSAPDAKVFGFHFDILCFYSCNVMDYVRKTHLILWFLTPKGGVGEEDNDLW